MGEPAWGAVLHGQLPGGRGGEGRRGVRAARRAVPGDAGVPGRREPPQLPVGDRAAHRGGVPARHAVQVLVLAPGERSASRGLCCNKVTVPERGVVARAAKKSMDFCSLVVL